MHLCCITYQNYGKLACEINRGTFIKLVSKVPFFVVASLQICFFLHALVMQYKNLS